MYNVAVEAFDNRQALECKFPVQLANELGIILVRTLYDDHVVWCFPDTADFDVFYIAPLNCFLNSFRDFCFLHNFHLFFHIFAGIACCEDDLLFPLFLLNHFLALLLCSFDILASGRFRSSHGSGCCCLGIRGGFGRHCFFYGCFNFLNVIFHGGKTVSLSIKVLLWRNFLAIFLHLLDNIFEHGHNFYPDSTIGTRGVHFCEFLLGRFEYMDSVHGRPSLFHGRRFLFFARSIIIHLIGVVCLNGSPGEGLGGFLGWGA